MHPLGGRLPVFLAFSTCRIDLRSSGRLRSLRLSLFRGKELRSFENDPSPAHIQPAEEVDDDVLHLARGQGLMKAVFDDDVGAVWKAPSNLFSVARRCFTVQ